MRLIIQDSLCFILHHFSVFQSMLGHFTGRWLISRTHQFDWVCWHLIKVVFHISGQHSSIADCDFLVYSYGWAATGSMDQKLIIWDLAHQSSRCTCEHDVSYLLCRHFFLLRLWMHLDHLLIHLHVLLFRRAWHHWHGWVRQGMLRQDALTARCVSGTASPGTAPGSSADLQMWCSRWPSPPTAMHWSLPQQMALPVCSTFPCSCEGNWDGVDGGCV